MHKPNSKFSCSKKIILNFAQKFLEIEAEKLQTGQTKFCKIMSKLQNKTFKITY